MKKDTTGKRLTAEDVGCAKCANCINNGFRIRTDDPELYWGCEQCYLDRVNGEEEILNAKRLAIWHAGNVYGDWNTRTFMNCPATFDHDRYVSDNLKRLEIMREWKDVVIKILNSGTIDEVKAMSDMYEKMYFGEGAKA